ncbi:MAG: 4-hydroxybenzoate octaprenyltransferase [Geminicoccaceae bacterium]|nr:4-hydroxybenzoate octaprenyltransferase [Geminicoccaceae bacterium]
MKFLPDQQLGLLTWVPPRWRDYGLLARLDRPIGTWLLLIPCWWGMALGAHDVAGWSIGALLGLAALFGIGAVAMRAAGCTINDLADRDFDRMVERTRNRPLAAGRLSVTQALVFLAVLLAIGLLVLAAMPAAARWIAVAAMPLVIAYPFMKRITWWPQAFLGLTFNWGALVGHAAVQGGLGIEAFLLYAAGFFWTLGYDTIYAHQDKADDMLIGVKSAALRLGEATGRWICVFYAAMLALLVAAGASAGLNGLYFAALVLPAAHLGWQIVRLEIDDTGRCLALFRANRWTGLLVLAALVLGHA